MKESQRPSTKTGELQVFRYVDSPKLFRAGVCQVSAIFNRELWMSLHPTEASAYISVVGSASVRRKSEYVAGRRCAIRALEMHLGSGPLNPSIVGTGQHRMPLWPRGTVGSITHTGGFASAAVSRGDRVRSLGLDSEELIPREQALELGPSIGCKEEIERITAAYEPHEDVGLTVLFSAKESLFKCLFPMTFVYFDFLDARLVNANAADGSITLELSVDLSSDFPRGWSAAGTVQVELPYVHTSFMLPRSGPQSNY
jgi:enterobactin synthetase component D